MVCFNITFSYIADLISQCNDFAAQKPTTSAPDDDDESKRVRPVTHSDLEALSDNLITENIMAEYEGYMADATSEFLKQHPVITASTGAVKNSAWSPERVELAHSTNVDKIAKETAILPLWSAIFKLLKRDIIACLCFALIRSSFVFVQIFALSTIIDLVGDEGKYSPFNTHLGVEMLFAVLLALGAWTQSLMQHNIFHNSWVNGLRARAFLCGRIYQKALCQTPLHVGASSGGGGAAAAGKKSGAAGGGKKSGGGNKGSLGQQMNLISSDSNVVVEAFVMLIFLLAAPVEVFAALVWIFMLVRWSAFGALALIAVLLPLQLKLGRLVGMQRGKSFSFADKRISVLTEFLGGIGVVKFNGWELPIHSHVSGLRQSESNHLTHGTTLKLLNLTLFFIVPGVLALVTLGVMNTYDTEMDGRTTFVVLALLQVIARSFAMVPRATTSWASAFTSVDRIEAFLLKNVAGSLPSSLPDDDNSTEPIVEDEIAQEKQSALVGRVCVKGTFSWRKSKTFSTNPPGSLSPATGGAIGETPSTAASPSNLAAANSHGAFALKNVDFDSKNTPLSCVVGAVGSGKSTFLHAIMKNCAQEIERCDDEEGDPLSAEKTTTDASSPCVGVLCKGRTAYVPQEAWIQDGTIRDNILFGAAYDEEKYWHVLSACSLLHDLLQWGGDMVEVGEKGVTLSGGQRQRVAMARAVYSDADVFLLDDPLSAVDAHVAKHLLDNCIAHPDVLGKKTVILVTHNIMAINKADKVLRFDEESGEYEQLGTDQIRTTLERMMAEQQMSHGSDESGNAVAASPKGGDIESTSTPTAAAATTTEDPSEAARAVLGKGRRLLSSEESAIKGVGADVYATYIAAGGKGKFVAFAITLLLAQGIKNAADWWFAAWTNRDFDSLSNVDYLLIEIALVLGSAIFAVFRSVVYSNFALSASTQLHDNMFKSVLRSPMHFFETVPLGRIINRFAKDLDYCDDLLPRASFDFLQLIAVCLGSLSLLIYSIPWFAIVVVFFAFIFGKLLFHYLPAARQMKRLEGSSRSPSHQCFQATLAGLTTIRSFGKTDQWMDEFYRSVDVTSRAIITSDSSQRWVGIRMDWMTSLWVLSTGLLCVGLQDSLSRSIAGLALGQSLMLTGMLQFSVRMAAETESLMTAVERIDEYGRLTPENDPHATQEDEDGETPAAISAAEESVWPSAGHIEVDNLTVAYPSNPTVSVLKDLKFTIPAGQKFAIVGRTGAGKSTILQCFFRLIDIPEQSISVDGVAIGTLPLKQLRRGLAVIPQNPTLFNGTLRYNLDPFGNHADEELITALEKVQLLRRLLRSALSQKHNENASFAGGAEEINDDPTPSATAASPSEEEQLLTPQQQEIVLQLSIGEQGNSLSVGQKQLVCAARALLRDPKVLLMDEATANVDTETDAALQATIHEACKSTTVITIAHRLNTIMNYDTVMVLNRGELVEIGNPKQLCDEQPDGAFAKMVQMSSVETAGSAS